MEQRGIHLNRSTLQEKTSRSQSDFLLIQANSILHKTSDGTSNSPVSCLPVSALSRSDTSPAVSRRWRREQADPSTPHPRPENIILKSGRLGHSNPSIRHIQGRLWSVGCPKSHRCMVCFKRAEQAEDTPSGQEQLQRTHQLLKSHQLEPSQSGQRLFAGRFLLVHSCCSPLAAACSFQAGTKLSSTNETLERRLLGGRERGLWVLEGFRVAV